MGVVAEPSMCCLSGWVRDWSWMIPLSARHCVLADLERPWKADTMMLLSSVGLETSSGLDRKGKMTGYPFPVLLAELDEEEAEEVTAYDDLINGQLTTSQP